MNPPRHLRLSAWIALLVAATAAPLLAFAGMTLWSVLDSRERELDAALGSRARAMATAVDAEIRSWRAVLHTLADANDLRAGRLREFDEHARAAAARYDGWVVVIDSAGQQLVNTLRPAGAPLPKTAAGHIVEAVFRVGKPVTDFAFGAAAQRHIVSNAVPAWHGGQVVYCLALNFGPERLTRLLEAQKLPASWIGAIVDQRNFVVARSPDAEKRVGKPAPQALKEAAASGEAGITTYTMTDGRQGRVAFQRLAEVPWVLVLAVPVVELPSTRHLVSFGWIAAIMGLIAVGGAWFVGRTIARPIRRLAELAPTLPEGKSGELEIGSRIQEVGQLQQALVEAANRVRHFSRERERSVEALRRAGAYNRSLIEASLDPLVTIGPDGKITDVNRATEEATGRPRAELIGTDFSDYFTEPARARAGYQEVFREGLVRDYPLEFHHRDGQATPVLYNAAVYRDEAGEVCGVFAAARDITERERAAEEIRRLNEDLERKVVERTAELAAANKELEAFSYSVSHDLRAPLRAMSGFSRILLEEHAAQLSSKGKSYLQLVQENALQMGHLVDDLLAFSRLGRQALRVQPVDPTLVAREALEDLRSDREGRQVEVIIRDLPACNADPGLLKQVFVNLLSNALKFTRRCEVAHIEVGAIADFPSPIADLPEKSHIGNRKSEMVYFVRDNGVGFDMQYAGKLFQVFQRLHRVEEFEGTGVGLAIVQRIIRRHGGQVWVEAAEGRGATFYFTLTQTVDESTVKNLS